MTNSLAGLVLERLLDRKLPDRWFIDDLDIDMPTLPKSGFLSFSIEDWQLLVKNCGLNLPEEKITAIFMTAVHRSSVDKHARPQPGAKPPHRRRKNSRGSPTGSRASSPTSHADEMRPLATRAELEILMEELWKDSSMRANHGSPLSMIIALIKQVTDPAPRR